MCFPSEEGLGPRIENLRARVRNSAVRAGRDAERVRIVGVAKKHPVAVIEEALSHGFYDIGENFVQEWQSKAKALEDPRLRWHFVGRLQTNKARFLVGNSALIHSVDRLKLLDTIARLAREQDVVQDILIQVGVAGEQQKAGVSVEELADFYARALELDSVRVCGLMIFPPAVTDPEEARPCFRRGAELLEELRRMTPSNRDLPTELSMGMSHDFEIAVEEGATLIRLGTAIFGPRPGST